MKMAYRVFMPVLLLCTFLSDGVNSSRLRLKPSRVFPGMSLVEVYYNGQWGTVCPTYWNHMIYPLGRVVCRQLGYHHFITATSAWMQGLSTFDANKNQRVLLVTLSCTGNEKDVEDCNRWAFGRANRCPHTFDLIVKCASCSVPNCQTGKSVCANNGTLCTECIPPYITAGWNRGCRKPSCIPACRNNGTCIADNTCRCQAGYQGRFCELGGKLDEVLKPRLHVVEEDILSPLAWNDNPKISNNNMLCFVKIGIQGATLDTILTAESLNSADGLYGNYSMGPVDDKAEVNGSTRVACLQIRCPAFDINGSEQYTTVRVTVSSGLGMCRIRPTTFKMKNATVNFTGGHDLLEFTLQPGNNYGPYYGIYVSQGYREKAKYIAERSCFSGRDYRIDGINLMKNALANYVCT